MKYLIVALLLCASLVQAQTSSARLKIGEEFKVNHQTAHPYTAGTTGTVVFEQEFYNKNSAYIRLYFEDFDLGPDDYVEISTHNTGESMIYAGKGKIVGKEGAMISDFWSSVLFDERVTVRLHTRSGSTKHHGFSITKVAYGYSEEQLAAFLPTAKSSCGPNDIQRIACATSQQKDKAKAVCRLFIDGMYGCTGWLLGSQGHVMTNEHCITTTAEAQNTDFIFNDQYVNCSPSSTTKATLDVVASSSTIIKKNADMDYCLVLLPVNPTGTYGYLQLDENGPTNGSPIYIVHHPSSNPKSITSTSSFSFDNNSRISFIGATKFEYYAYIEGGSSGAPVLHAFRHKVLGVNTYKNTCGAGSYSPSDVLITDLGTLMPADGIPGAEGCVVRFPYTEGFEGGGMGTWSQATNDNHNWSNNTGGTSSSATGPSSAYNGSRYVYVESSSPHFNKTAILNSPCFNLSILSKPLLYFQYHMYGADMGNLALQISYNNTHWSTIWTRHSDRTNTWRRVIIDLEEIMSNASDLSQVRFRFMANTGSSYRSDIAIDDVRIAEDNNFLGCYRGVNLTYDFEDHRYLWNQSPTSLFGWVEQTGQSPQANGPSGAQSGLDYLHIYPSQTFPNIPSTGTLTSDCISLWNYTQPRISFYYNMPGSSYFNSGNLRLEISDDDGATWTTLWIWTLGTNSEWRRASVSIASYAPDAVKFRFIGSANSGYAVSLDNVNIYSSPSALPREDEPSNTTLRHLDEATPTLFVSPNPFQNYLNIETTLPEVQGYRLVNLQGQVVQEGDLQGSVTRLQLLDVVPGVYFITLYNQETQLVQKVIKQ